MIKKEDVKIKSKGWEILKKTPITVEEIAEQLQGFSNVSEIPYKRHSVPFSVMTYTRLLLISDNYDISLSKLIESLVEASLPQLEEQLEITSEDICDFFNANRPAGYEEAEAVSEDYVIKILKHNNSVGDKNE